MMERDPAKTPVNPHTGQPLPEDALNALERPVDAGTPDSERGPAPGSGREGGVPTSEKRSEPTPPQGTAAAPAGEPSGAAPPSAVPPGGSSGGPSDAPSQQEVAVRSALETVMDPEIGLSVIDLGLIREIHLLPDKTFIRMMLTTPFCPYAPQLMADVKQATTSVVPLPCEVEIMADPWSPELMPDPGLLGYSF